MEKSIFDKFRDLIYSESGISLNHKKEALLSARIAKRMRALHINEQKEYLEYVYGEDREEEIVLLIDAVSTNVTHFFREPDHFDFLMDEMSGWLNKGQNRFRMWSAGCSSGEEPYSMAMTLNNACNGQKPDMRILATDISTKILKISISGIYPEKKMEKVPENMIRQYFTRIKESGNNLYSVKDSLKNMILFRRLNLSVVPFPMKGPLDIIFCRNVMIYFDNEVRQRLLNEFYRLLKPDGYLMVGHSESLAGMLSGFKAIAPALYVKG